MVHPSTPLYLLRLLYVQYSPSPSYGINATAQVSVFNLYSHLFLSRHLLPCQLLTIRLQFELIQKLEGHHGEIWALAVSNKSAFVVTGSHDKSIRIWEKTDEPLLLDEERERELEQMYDTTDTSRPLDPNAEGAHIDEVEGVRKETVESLMAGERIMEAIELADADLEDSKAYELGGGTGVRQRDGRLVARNVGEGVEGVGEYVRGEIRRVPNASLEDAMLVLPFRGVVSLLTYLDSWARAVRPLYLLSLSSYFSP
jgi:U3 small nucleolar RNA-associated protein 12